MPEERRDEYQMLIPMIKEIQSDLKEVKEETRQIPVIKEKTDRVHECVYGNGPSQNSLTDRVSVNEAKIKWLWGVVASIGAAIVGLIGKAIAKMS